MTDRDFSLEAESDMRCGRLTVRLPEQLAQTIPYVRDAKFELWRRGWRR